MRRLLARGLPAAMRQTDGFGETKDVARQGIATAIAELDAAREKLAKKYPRLASGVELIREDRDSR